jgi:hypothetical protein
MKKLTKAHLIESCNDECDLDYCPCDCHRRNKLTKAQEKRFDELLWWLDKGQMNDHFDEPSFVNYSCKQMKEHIKEQVADELSRQKKETRLEMLGLFESALSKKIDLYRKARKEKGTKWGKKLEQHKRSREWVYGFEDAMWVIANAWKDLKKNA